MDRPKAVVSILNNDDNPAFAVRPVEHANYRPRPAVHHQRGPWSVSAIYPPHHEVSPAAPICFPRYAEQSTYGYRDAMDCDRPFSSHAAHKLSIHNITHSNPPSSDLPSPTASITSAPDVKAPKVSKKNKYPCPYATSHSCSATFTTSGHAARHGKKHTGEKGVLCPVCNKAFTRKDNMKQHRRTHRLSMSDELALKKAEDWGQQPWHQPRDRADSSTTALPDVDYYYAESPAQSPTNARFNFRGPGGGAMSRPYASVDDVMRPDRDGATGIRRQSAASSLTGGLDALAIVAVTSNTFR